MDRHRVMVVCNLVSGVALSALVAALSVGWGDLAMIYVVAVVLAVCDVAYTLALQGVVPDVVPSPDQLGLGNGRLMAVEGAGEQFLGPGVGGVLFSFARRLPFVGDGLSFFVSALLVHTSVRRSPTVPFTLPPARAGPTGPAPTRRAERGQHRSEWVADSARVCACSASSAP